MRQLIRTPNSPTPFTFSSADFTTRSHPACRLCRTRPPTFWFHTNTPVFSSSAHKEQRRHKQIWGLARSVRDGRLRPPEAGLTRLLSSSWHFPRSSWHSCAHETLYWVKKAIFFSHPWTLKLSRRNWSCPCFLRQLWPETSSSDLALLVHHISTAHHCGF